MLAYEARCCFSNIGRGFIKPSLLRRSLFSFPKFPFLSPTEVQRFKEQRILPYEREQLYNVVSDVASYPHFVPFCTSSRIISPATEKPAGSGKLVMEAELTVGFHSFVESYVSRVTCIPYESVHAEAASTTPLFRTLQTTWTFKPTSDVRSATGSSPFRTNRPTLVILDLAYAFANPLHATVSSAFFGQISGEMVKAFEERCHQIYGLDHK
ncbi:hypothetical protein AMATHDRAFT_156099 [Amanita thiersii Skay4041]|uniref:Coenzyme Q-binding protein COQ10 START domain-containing protein n=1 Tax=Amanita thiersii Skay4041 TaxID=703135 RepID=A0A2A9ND29_9AGAR|nr:hypothetical protein AMATHDRAFT_156099 [Amanita thiersii Skay4041]